MPALNWGMIQDGGAFESLMHAILYAEDAGTILFGRPGKDAGQDARSADGNVVYQAKYRQGLVMDGAVELALKELDKIKEYRQPEHSNYVHWQHVRRWVLVANLSINPNDDEKWETRVVPVFLQERLTAEYWYKETLEGKLAEHPEVREVFFGGENRVLVGLKEAHDFLSAVCIGSASLEAPMVGRDDEMRRVNAFADSDDKRVLPVVGPGGIGKSRLLYESLVSLSQNGWRVLWALPKTMARSARWFHLLNGSQRTCVAIDDPDDPGLVRAVIEQLAAVERRNWKVIIACRTDKAKALRRFQDHRMVEQPMLLGPLNQPASKQLLNACIGSRVQESWLHSVYTHTKGVPGWLCLIAKLARRGSLSELPSSVDGLAAAYVDSCLQSLDEPQRQQGLTLLRWLALWGVLRVDTVSEEQAEPRFLKTRGIPTEALTDLLRDLVGTGLVRNWGVAKRLHAVEPPIIRQQILSSWLLADDGGTYQVNTDGTLLVAQLVQGEMPAVDLVLRTLSHLTLSRLAEPEGESFLKPVFVAMLTIASAGTVLDQCRVADLAEKTGAADPESALDVLATIRRSPKESMEVDVSPWGPQAFTHGSLLANLPWAVFQIAEYVSERVVARRYLEEFRELVAIEDADGRTAGAGNGARQLLKRLLCESKNSETYAQPAHDMVAEELASARASPFAGLLLECLLNPERESIEWVANWTITIARRAFLPDSLEWNLAADLRGKVFATLRTGNDPDIRVRLWHILAESHHEFHRAIFHGNVRGNAVAPYRTLLVDDLTNCAAILKSSAMQLTIEEATHAREMWSWYLEYGRAEDLVDIARQCEQIYNGLSKWRLHVFFRFDHDEELAPETARVVALLRAAPDPEIFTEFFFEARRYLDVARRGERDGADFMRISALGDACADLLSLEVTPPPNALTSFVVTVLKQAEDENSIAWTFAIRVCQRHLRSIKAAEDEVALENILKRLLGVTESKARVLYGLYSHVHPLSTGTLTKTELDCVLAHESGFSAFEWFALLGAFAVVSWDTVQLRLRIRLEALREQPVEASNCIACFVRAIYLAALRYDWQPTQLPTAWIMDMIREFGLDGALLGMHDLIWLRDQADFRLDVAQLVALIRSRMELEQRPRPGNHFEIAPHDLEVSAWCSFDEANPAEVDAFHEFCCLALGHGFIAVYWMPKYVAQLNPSGQHVGSFVEQYLRDNQTIDGNALARLAYLASAYPDNSEAWASIARPICSRANRLRRDEREHVYFGLCRKETGVITSSPGEVAGYYVQTLDDAERMLAAAPFDSPLRPYREWRLQRAKEDFLRETGRAEEDANE